MKGPTRILLVEDDPIVRAWVRGALEATEFVIAAEAGALGEALALLDDAEGRPDLLLVDQRLPDGLGTKLVELARRRGVESPAVLMTAGRPEAFSERARLAGAQGTVFKSARPGELIATLRKVRGGGNAFRAHSTAQGPGIAPLSPRERDVVRLVATGATNAAIAEELGIGAETVKTLLARVFRKLGTTRRAEAVTEAHRRGLL